MNKQRVLSVRLQASEVERLERLAKSSGRSRGQVIKRLLTLANNPANRQALGIIDEKEGNHDRITEQA